MGVFSKAKSLLQPPQKPASVNTTFGWGAESTQAYDAGTTLALYNTSGYLRAVVDLVGRGVASARWRAFKRVAAKGRKAVRDFSLASAPFAVRTRAIAQLQAAHELVELPGHKVLQLLDQPNEDLTGFQFLSIAQAHVDIAGETFILATRDADGEVNGLHLIPPHCVHDTPSAASPFYRVAYESINGFIPKGDVLWLKTPNPVQPLRRGSGLAATLSDELQAAESIGVAIKAAMGRSGLPISIVAVDQQGGVPGEALTKLKKDYESGFSGPANAGKPMFASGKLSWTTIAADFRQLQAAELSKELLGYVRQCFGVSVEMLGEMSGADRSKADAARWIFADQVLAPRLEMLRGCLQKWLVPLVDAEVILHHDEIRPQEREQLAGLMTNGVTATAFKMNEARALAGLPALPELEGKFLLPMPGQKPLNDGGE